MKPHRPSRTRQARRAHAKVPKGLRAPGTSKSPNPLKSPQSPSPTNATGSLDVAAPDVRAIVHPRPDASPLSDPTMPDRSCPGADIAAPALFRAVRCAGTSAGIHSKPEAPWAGSWEPLVPSETSRPWMFGSSSWACSLGVSLSTACGAACSWLLFASNARRRAAIPEPTLGRAVGTGFLLVELACSCAACSRTALTRPPGAARGFTLGGCEAAAGCGSCCCGSCCGSCCCTCCGCCGGCCG
mmetsp:Transcript_10972/g.25002  ORF Transcript_10972/g.25002 Transcript_10972/m.25002 type:complete len:242 (+) Transcript_10972:527-1252(+)